MPDLIPLLLSQTASEHAVRHPVTATFRALSQLRLMSRESQVKVWLVLDWVRRKQD